MQQACMDDVRVPKQENTDLQARPWQCSTIFVPPGRLPQSLHRLYGHTWPGFMDINAVPTFPQLSMLLQPSSDPIHHRKPIGNLPRACRTPIEHLSIYRIISHIYICWRSPIAVVRNQCWRSLTAVLRRVPTIPAARLVRFRHGSRQACSNNVNCER